MSQLRRDISHMTGESGQTPKPLVLMERSLAAIIVAMLAAGIHRALTTNINWDEFYFLSLVHLHQNETLAAPLQTLHVHLFGWLPFISENEIHQIFAARTFVWLLSLASCWLIYDIARKFCSKEASLFPVLFYFGFSYVMDHGLSFRADPFCAFLFLASLKFLLDGRSQPHMAISAFLMAAAMLVSVKSVFYLATIGPILLVFVLDDPVKPGTVSRALFYLIAFAAASILLYLVHSTSLASASMAEAGAAMMNAGNKTLLSNSLIPRAHYIVRALAENPLIWVFVFLGLGKAGLDAVKGNNRKRALILVSLALPLLSLLIYRNAFPYYYVFLLPAAVILGGLFADMLITHFLRSGAKILMVLLAATVLLISASFVTDYVRKLPDQTIAQSEIVALVHRMYPAPVPYIDRNSMIASFPKAGFFMSGWGMETYRDGNTAIMEQLIRQRQPNFLIVNSCTLNVFGPPDRKREPCRYRLLDGDIASLQNNFVHHWGPLYVAGKTFDLKAPQKHQSFETLIAGTYTLEAGATVTIDGVVFQPGDKIRLEQGGHTIAASGTATRAVLRLGANLPRPDHPPSAQQIYFNF